MLSNHCLLCGYTRMPIEGKGEFCPKCQAPYSVPPITHTSPKEIKLLPSDPIDRAWELRDFSKLNQEQIISAARKVNVCTTDSIPGKTTLSNCGLVSGTYTFAFGAVFEAFAGVARNLVGSGSSPQTEHHINNGISKATAAMQVRALQLGADGVVGARYSFEEFSGANNLGVIAVIVTGTAIKCD